MIIENELRSGGLIYTLFMNANAADDWRVAFTLRRTMQIGAELFACSLCPLPLELGQWGKNRSNGRVYIRNFHYKKHFANIFYGQDFVNISVHFRLFTDASSRSIAGLNRVNFNARFILKTLMTLCPDIEYHLHLIFLIIFLLKGIRRRKPTQRHGLYLFNLACCHHIFICWIRRHRPPHVLWKDDGSRDWHTDVSLGFAAGVMTAASFWSLLAPAIEISEHTMGSLAFLPVAIGFAVGSAFVHFADRLLPSCVMGDTAIIDHLAPAKTETEISLVTASDRDSAAQVRYGHVSVSPAYRTLRQRGTALRPLSDDREAGEDSISKEKVSANHVLDEDYRTSWRRILLLILAVTVHNIPEGLAVGVGFGSAGKTPAATFESAFNLAVGIGLQNFPEGLAVSLPLAAFGHSKLKAFWYGQLSGMVEPIAALLGAAAVIFMEPVLPYALSFAAGAMIYVVVDDIIPEAQRNGNGKMASVGCIVGFLVMMCMDVGLG
uniref:Zinc transporter ZIP11 n=1 Tax=Heterorhabditis bacteriophora TaxID=37862 RepID=A0A1I7XNK5_HETBA